MNCGIISFSFRREFRNGYFSENYPIAKIKYGVQSLMFREYIFWRNFKCMYVNNYYHLAAVFTGGHSKHFCEVLHRNIDSLYDSSSYQLRNIGRVYLCARVSCNSNKIVLSKVTFGSHWSEILYIWHLFSIVISNDSIFTKMIR